MTLDDLPHQLDGLNWLLISWRGMTLRARDGARAPRARAALPSPP